ncbi:hypothetical protein GCK72_003051 [Caenorhabditis remanei]|uniref:UvrD-like helicase C-terminal domain-containing protein n=1 Tax=Caenorhabditis remanei TaxID=31234 RepID=A0A6A5HUF3_CAERE|nr:hypothetical protein GCK72_003051 [Caenorhabditis remanei]KAF1771225.1 hypothetical protein GCK72_003051 [Caenorhabditis remanei]
MMMIFTELRTTTKLSSQNRIFKTAIGARIMVNENLKCELMNGDTALVQKVYADQNQNVERLTVTPADSNEIVTIYQRQPQENGRQQQQKPFLPVLPAYAVTYHKAQGQTLDTVFLELPRSMNASLFFTGASRAIIYGTRLHLLNQDKWSCSRGIQSAGRHNPTPTN